MDGKSSTEMTILEKIHDLKGFYFFKVVSKDYSAYL